MNRVPNDARGEKLVKWWRGRPVAGVLAVLILLSVPGCGVSRNEPRSFSSAGEAVQALVSAVRVDDVPTLRTILGSHGEEILSSGDEVADRQRRQKFLALYDEKHEITQQGSDQATLVVGNTDWPFPIPLVREGTEGWVFDTAAGKEEILNRRIGENELTAMEVCKAIGDAEREYALQTKDVSGMHEYAQKFASDPGQRNGLYWPAVAGQPPSPLGAMVAQAAAEGYRRREEGPVPYRGYYYRILRVQGSHAPEGALDYVVKGRMVLGFAVLAYPAEYGNSGIMTFLMSDEGVVYQKDLGKDTAKLAAAINTFDPGPGWKKVEP